MRKHHILISLYKSQRLENLNRKQNGPKLESIKEDEETKILSTLLDFLVLHTKHALREIFFILSMFHSYNFRKLCRM